MKEIKIIWIIIFVIGCLVRGTHLLQPINTSSWREADVSAIARNFYTNGTDIFHPQIGYGGDSPGYVESEFQLYTYLIATWYKVFGFWEQTGRILSFIFSILTMLVFFKLCRYLLNTKEALLSSAFFAISPLLMGISVGVQPEACMFFFYLAGAYTFIRWLDSGSVKFYWLTILCTSLAILCKITAANIGIFFVVLLINKRGWKYLLNGKVLMMGLLITLPSVIWYSYCHKFYLLYGNSLGISNEDHWIGWDFITNYNFLFGLIKNEVANVWTIAGPLILILALAFTGIKREKNFKVGMIWYCSVFLFYIITCRTTSLEWAWYYHIFSVPSVSILLGVSVAGLYDGYMPQINFGEKFYPGTRKTEFKRRFIMLGLIFLTSFALLSGFRYLVRTKPGIYQISKWYSCRNTLQTVIPKNSLILTDGGPAKDADGYALAIDIGYFYYWLDRKGFSISTEKLSFSNIESYKKKGVKYFVAEEQKLKLVRGLEDELKSKLKVLFECNGCILFSL